MRASAAARTAGSRSARREANNAASSVDDGTDAAISGLAAAIKLVIPLGAVSSGAPGTIYEGVYINPNGLPLAAGLRFALTTAAGGIVISAAADGGDGFCLTTP